jgi:glyoxylate reductase
MPRIFVSRTIPEAGLAMLRDEAELDIFPHGDDASPSVETILAGVRQADVLLSHLTEKIDEAVMTANPKLRGIANYAVGFNNIDIPTATRLGLPIGNTPGILTDTTADLAWTLILSTARRVVEADKFMRGGDYKLWGPSTMLGYDISPGGSGRRKVLGLIGFGAIGRAVAKRAVGFDMDILAYDPFASQDTEGLPVTFVELPDLLKQSDVVSIHTPLNEDTHHLIGTEELAMMKSDALLINSARGPIIDEAALVTALRERKIAGAGLDVYEDEPVMSPGLAELGNAILLPHIGSATIDTRNQMATRAAGNALAFLKGERAPFTVNPEVYDTAAYKKRLGK